MRILLSGYYGQGNFGDDLLLKTIVKNLPDHSIGNLSYDVLAWQKVPKLERLRLFIAQSKVVMAQHDWLVFGGGTTFHENMPLQYFICRLAKKQGLRIAAIGVGTRASGINKFLLRRIVAMSACFLVRDHYSLMQCGSKAKLTADLVFANKFEFKRDVHPARTIGISLVKGARDYGKIWGDFHSPDDLRVVYLNCQHEEGRKLSANAPTEGFEDLDVILGMRLHTLILAAMMGIPFVGINHDPKIAELCKTFEMPCLPVSADNWAIVQAVNAAKLSPNHADILSDQVSLARWNFRILRQFLGYD